jgi:hypothetical protein
MNLLRNLFALSILGLAVACVGCGWATPASKKNSLTGVSESGYPKGQPADSGSPALGSMHKAEAEKKPAEAK